ncbi:MAG: XisI protein [Symploca sp. SIO2C1]|nr:XisI protein [Symploca sp. SIO2C1]
MADLEKIEKYRVSIRQILEQYARYKPSHGNIEIQTIFDTEHDHYQVVAIGWDEKERVYGCSIHLDIKDRKIWIQVNNTEWDIGQALIDLNIPKEDIVIGFQPPYLRRYSGYAVV